MDKQKHRYILLKGSHYFCRVFTEIIAVLSSKTHSKLLQMKLLVHQTYCSILIAMFLFSLVVYGCN